MKTKLGVFFVTLKDDRPEWLKDAIYAAHHDGGDLPNDWIYAECKAACDAIDDELLIDDNSVHEYADSRVDIYTKVLYRWAADMQLTDTWRHAEEEANEIGSDETNITKRMVVIQYCAIEFIARTMLEAVRENADDDDDEASEENDAEPVA